MITIKLLFEILLFSTIGSRDYPASENTSLPQRQTYFHSTESEDEPGRDSFYYY